jgi:hypothetical protein
MRPILRPSYTNRPNPSRARCPTRACWRGGEGRLLIRWLTSFFFSMGLGDEPLEKPFPPDRLLRQELGHARRIASISARDCGLVDIVAPFQLLSGVRLPTWVLLLLIRRLALMSFTEVGHSYHSPPPFGPFNRECLLRYSRFASSAASAGLKPWT